MLYVAAGIITRIQPILVIFVDLATLANYFEYIVRAMRIITWNFRSDEHPFRRRTSLKAKALQSSTSNGDCGGRAR